MGHLDETLMEQVNTAIAVSFGIGIASEPQYVGAGDTRVSVTQPAAVASVVPKGAADITAEGGKM